MRRYFIDRIEGLPPKKDGASSMWNKGVELPRIILLRQAAHTAFGSDPPLAENIEIVVRVHVGLVNSSDDLDNFITGICDGLQAAHPNTPLADQWVEPDLESVHPKNPVAIVNDVDVVSIDAKKLIGDEPQWYSLELAGD